MTATATSVAQIKTKRSSGAALAWRRFLRKRWAVVALGFILFEILVAIAAPLLAPYDPVNGVDYTAYYSPPTAKHWMGTDDIGRDVFSRIIFGTRVSYTVGVLSQVLIVLIGLPIGAIAGLVGGALDYAIMRVIDVLSSVPGLLLYILLMIALGAGVPNIILAMAITGWIGIARLVRGQVLTLKESDFVRAARSMGGDTSWVIRTHVLRNSLSPVIVSLTLGVPGAMFAEAGLSFLGLGVPSDTPSWGQMIGVYQTFVRTSPHLILFPGIVLAITMLAWIVLGDGVRDALDPNIRS